MEIVPAGKVKETYYKKDVWALRYEMKRYRKACVQAIQFAANCNTNFIDVQNLTPIFTYAQEAKKRVIEELKEKGYIVKTRDGYVIIEWE